MPQNTRSLARLGYPLSSLSKTAQDSVGEAEKTIGPGRKWRDEPTMQRKKLPQYPMKLIIVNTARILGTLYSNINEPRHALGSDRHPPRSARLVPSFPSYLVVDAG